MSSRNIEHKTDDSAGQISNTFNKSFSNVANSAQSLFAWKCNLPIGKPQFCQSLEAYEELPFFTKFMGQRKNVWNIWRPDYIEFVELSDYSSIGSAPRNTFQSMFLDESNYPINKFGTLPHPTLFDYELRKAKSQQKQQQQHCPSTCAVCLKNAKFALLDPISEESSESQSLNTSFNFCDDS